MNKLKTVMIVISLQIASIFSQKSNLSYNIDLLLNSEDKMNIANDELSNKTLNLDQLEKKYLFLKKSYRFKEAGAIIEEINKSFATEIQAKSLLADWAYFTMDYQLAESLYKDLLKVNPQLVDKIPEYSGIFRNTTLTNDLNAFHAICHLFISLNLTIFH